MQRNKKIYLGLAMLLLAAIPVVLAHVIYVYSGTISVGSITPPITLAVGPNGYASPYITTSVNGRDYGFSVTLSITNSTYDYYYEFLTLIVSQSVYIYFNTSTTSTTSTYIQNAWLVVSTSTGTTVATVQIIRNGRPVSPAPSTPITLSPGTYCLSLVIQPNVNSLPSSPTSSLTSFSVGIAANVVSNAAVPLPFP